MNRNIAIFDLGKTHAKVILYDPAAQREIAVFQEKNTILAGPPFPHFDIEALQSFLLNALARIAADHAFGKIFVSTHGAGVAVMKNGTLALPVLDYEFDGPDEFADEYDALRPPFAITGTPRMGLGLNLGAQLYWLARRFPNEMAGADTLLFWPQFWTHWLSGVAASEVAYASCHGDLWDLRQQDFVPLSNFGLPETLAYPPVRASSEILGTLRPELAARAGLPETLEICCGGHDSSLSLVSVARDYPGPCTVLSTGTWVTMFALAARSFEFAPEPGLMVSLDCQGRVTPNFRFPGGQIYADLLDRMQGTDAPPPAADLALAGYDTAATTRVLHEGTPADISAWDPAKGRDVISEVLARLALHGLRAIDARGPIVLSGPFESNAIFLEHLKAQWDAPIHIEENLQGICKGIAACVEGSKATRPTST